MPINLSIPFAAHIDSELTTLATLWTVTRQDGEVYYFTDHDKDLVKGGNTYIAGIGYNRTAVEDKADLSVDNMDVQGVLNTTSISREDVRGGRFDGAEVILTIVNFKFPDSGEVIRRRGWFGQFRQNNRGEFDVELRGLSEALSEAITYPYTPGCRADLGDAECRVPLASNEREDGTSYYEGQWMTLPEYPDLSYQCTVRGTTSDASTFDIYEFDVAVGDTVVDGDLVWTAFKAMRWDFTIIGLTDRKTFEISINGFPTSDDLTFFDGGLIYFETGDNSSIAREVLTYATNSDDSTGIVTLYLRMPFEVGLGDTGYIAPGCDKSLATCKNKFGNVLNFRGFPHIPGDKYLKDYPDAKS